MGRSSGKRSTSRSSSASASAVIAAVGVRRLAEGAGRARSEATGGAGDARTPGSRSSASPRSPPRSSAASTSSTQMTADLDGGRTRPFTTVLDILRTRIDPDALRRGDLLARDRRRRPRLRRRAAAARRDRLDRPRCAPRASRSRSTPPATGPRTPLVLAGVGDRFDVDRLDGPRTAADASARSLEAARASRPSGPSSSTSRRTASSPASRSGAHLAIALARGPAHPGGAAPGRRRHDRRRPAGAARAARPAEMLGERRPARVRLDSRRERRPARGRARRGRSSWRTDSSSVPSAKKLRKASACLAGSLACICAADSESDCAS